MTVPETTSKLPIFRSDSQARILALLFLNPEAELQVADVAQQIGMSTTATYLEIRRLEQGGLVYTRRDWKSRMVRAAVDSELFGPLQQLLHITHGEYPIIDGPRDEQPILRHSPVEEGFAEIVDEIPADAPVRGISAVAAAARYRCAPSTVRTWYNRARRKGINLRVHPDLWPDMRTPLYDVAKLDAFVGFVPDPNDADDFDVEVTVTTKTGALVGHSSVSERIERSLAECGYRMQTLHVSRAHRAAG